MTAPSCAIFSNTGLGAPLVACGLPPVAVQPTDHPSSSQPAIVAHGASHPRPGARFLIDHCARWGVCPLTGPVIPGTWSTSSCVYPGCPRSGAGLRTVSPPSNGSQRSGLSSSRLHVKVEYNLALRLYLRNDFVTTGHRGT